MVNLFSVPALEVSFAELLECLWLPSWLLGQFDFVEVLDCDQGMAVDVAALVVEVDAAVAAVVAAAGEQEEADSRVLN